MTKFFSRHSRPRHNKTKESGLSDKTNFPLLSSKWMRGQDTSSANFSARRLLCFADPRSSLTQPMSPPEYVKPDPKAVSPSQDVASTWMQMGESTGFDAVSSSSWSSSATRPTTNRTQPTISSHVRDRATTQRTAPLRSSATTLSSTRTNTYQRSTRTAHSTSSRSNTSMRKLVSRSASHSEWRSAVDPKSGRTYYYNVVSRATQWRKPIELASPEERKEMEAKEKKQKEFFSVMEANILKQMATGQVPGTPTVSPTTSTDEKKEPTRPQKPMLEKPRMVRTISGMDDQILRELVKRVPSLRSSKMVRDNSMGMDDLNKFDDENQMRLSALSEESSLSTNMSAMDISWADLNYDMMDEDSDSPTAREENRALMQLAKTAEKMAMASGSAKGSPSETPTPTEKKMPSNELKRPSLDSRRNTCGTIYVGSTLSAPDKDATIKVRERTLLRTLM